MKEFKILVVVLFGAALLIHAAIRGAQERREKFRQTGVIDEEKGDALTSAMSSASEAPTGFDNLTNGFNIQGPPFDSINEENVVPLRSFNDNRFIFEEAETFEDGLQRAPYPLFPGIIPLKSTPS